MADAVIVTVPALLAYFLLAFGIAWTGVLLAASHHNIYLTFVAMLLGPSLASVGLTAVLEGTRGLRELAQRMRRWRMGARWYATLAVAPGLLLAVLSILATMSPSFLPDLVAADARARVVVYALVAGLGAGVFEELGWTGFVTPRLLRRFTWFETGIVLGLPWALWHALPDFVMRAEYGSLWIVHIAQWFVALTAFRVFMTWVYERTQSVLLAMLLHASFTGGQALLWPSGASPAAELVWYGIFACSLWVVALIVAARDAGLSRPAISA